MSTADASAGDDRIGEAIHVDTDGTTRPDGISESEHEAIVGAVNALLTDRAKPPEAMPRGGARRSGAGMAVLTNLVILLALAGAVYAYVTFVPRSAPDVNPFSGQVATTESAILAEVREQTERRLSEREAEIARIERELNALRSTRTDADPSVGSSQRERELLAELDSLNATASERLGALADNRDRIGFLTDQLTTIYDRIGQAIRAQDYERARTLVDDAGALIAAPGVQDEPLLAEAARAISGANEVLAQVLPLAAEDSSRLAVLAEQVEEINLIVAQADARATAGELESAESLYRSALRTFDGTERAVAQLLAIEEQRFEERLADQTADASRRISLLDAQLRESRTTVASLQARIASLTSERNQLAADVENLRTEVTRAEAAADRAREGAAELGTTVTSLESDIEDLQTEIATREQRISALETERRRDAAQAAREIAELRATVDSINAASRETGNALATAAGDVARELAATAPEEAGPEVIDLLSTRVLLRAVVDSPSVREQYPRLYDDMETYFTALSRSRIEEGRTAAYTRASEAVEALAAGMAIAIATEAPADTATGYLERVVGLVRGAIGSVE